MPPKKPAAKKPAAKPKGKVGRPKGSFKSKTVYVKDTGISMGQSSHKPTIQRQKGYLPFPNSYLCRLPYVENYVATADGVSLLSQVPRQYSTNSMYDPRYTLGGHQPFQYDGLAVAYERVWVWGAKCVLTFSNPSADGLFVGYRLRGNTNGVSTNGRDIEYLQEMRDSAMKPLNNTGSQTVSFTFYVDNPKILGLDKMQYSNLEYSHITGGNPAVYCWLEPYVIQPVAAADITCNVNLKMIMYGQFTNPITQNQS